MALHPFEVVDVLRAATSGGPASAGMSGPLKLAGSCTDWPTLITSWAPRAGVTHRLVASFR